MHKGFIRDIVASLGMFVVLSVAVVLDNWLAVWRVEAGSSFDFSKAMPAMTWTRLIMAGLFLLLTWYVLVWEMPGLTTAGIYTLLGLFVAFLPTLHFVAQWSMVLGLTRTFWSKGFGYLLLDAGALIAMIGIIAFIKIGWSLRQNRIGSETAVTNPTPE